MSWLDDVDIQFEYNDLISMNVNAIVCPTTIKLEDYGRISKKIFDLGGSHLIKNIISTREQLPNHSLPLGQAISLECKRHYKIGNFERLILVALWAFHSEYNHNLFYKAYINSFREAFHHNLKSLALPVMAYDGSLRICGQAILEVIQSLDRLKKSSEFSVKEVLFVTTDRNHIKFLKKEVEPKLYF